MLGVPSQLLRSGPPGRLSWRNAIRPRRMTRRRTMSVQPVSYSDGEDRHAAEVDCAAIGLGLRRSGGEADQCTTPEACGSHRGSSRARSWQPSSKA